MILVSTDVLREIPRDIAENLAKRRFTRIAANDEAVAQLGETNLMTRIVNREKAAEIQFCFSSQEFLESGIGAQSP